MLLFFKRKYRQKGGYSKTLKKIYINWAKKQGFKYITGHVRQGSQETFQYKLKL